LEAVAGWPAKGPGCEELRTAGRLVVLGVAGATLVSTAMGTASDGGACRFCTLFNCPRGEIVLMAGAGVGREAGKEAGPDAGRVNAGGGGLAGGGFAVLTTPAGPGNDGAKSGCMVFRLASSRVAPGSGAGVGKEAGKEAGLAAGRVSGGRGGLASPGASVFTASACPDNDGALSAFFMVFRLASSEVAPGSGAGVGKEAGQETVPDAG
jgi:hypothetical protein